MIWPDASLDCHIWDTWSSVTGPSLINARLKKMTEFLGPNRGVRPLFSPCGKVVLEENRFS